LSKGVFQDWTGHRGLSILGQAQDNPFRHVAQVLDFIGDDRTNLRRLISRQDFQHRKRHFGQAFTFVVGQGRYQPSDFISEFFADALINVSRQQQVGL
jgi:hypothetical protein